jgi:hypothetical protein
MEMEERGLYTEMLLRIMQVLHLVSRWKLQRIEVILRNYSEGCTVPAVLLVLGLA